MTAKEVIKRLEKDGWIEQRQRGSHKQFAHPSKANLITVPDHGNKELHKGTVHKILKLAGLK